MLKHARFSLFFSLVIALGVFIVDAAVFTAAFSSLVPRANAQAVTTYYYVDYATGNDANSGTQNAPWKTVQKAASTAVAGNTVIFAPGTYPGNATFGTSGTASSRITFSGGTWTGAYAVNGSYITFTGQTFTGYGDPVFQYEGTNGEIKNFSYNTGLARKFVNWNGNNGLIDTGDVTGLALATSGGGVFIATGGNNITVRNVNLHDNDNTEAFGYIWGTNIKIIGNTMINSDNSRYDLVHADFLQVFAYNGTATSNNVEVAGNRIINSDVQAFMLNAKNTGVPTSPNIHHWYIHNNIFVNSWQSASIYVPYTEIANNVFYNWGTNNGYAFAVRSGGTDPNSSYSIGTNVSIYNNAFIGTTYSPELEVNADYNYRDSGSLPNGTHNKTGSAGFANAAGSDFTLTSASPLRDAGTTIASFSTDFSGTSRPQGSAWDIGAYEYTGTTQPPPAGGSQNNPPTVSITSPAYGYNFPGTIATVIVAVSASDSDGVVSRVDFYLDNVLQGFDDSADSFNFQFGGVETGPHTFKAVAYDGQDVSAPDFVNVSVGPSSAQGSASGVPHVIGCTNPTTSLTGGAKPCPVMAVSTANPSATESLSITFTPLGSSNYIYRNFYISEYDAALGKPKWGAPRTLACGDVWCRAQTTFLLPLSSLLAGGGGNRTYYIASWDWTWNGACFVGPEGSCSSGKWRIQKFTVN